MNSARRVIMRSTRSTKYRLQVTIFIIAVSLLTLFVYTHRQNEHLPDEPSEQPAFVPKKVREAEPTTSPRKADTSSESEPTNCAYRSCPKLPDDDEVINVHVICHTHLDPGWLNSVDGYFFGIQHDRNNDNGGRAHRLIMPSVLTIFNNVMGALLENADRRFVMVEMSYIWRWWKRLDEDYKRIIRRLMQEGRIDIAGGSWTSNDEAVGHYSAMIDQSTLGFRFIKNELRSCSQPAVAWQLDLFGHGREINSLFAQMGYDAILFGRLDYQEKDQRTTEKTLQMVWKVDDDAPESQRWLFTGILPNLYHPPEQLALKSDVAGSLLRASDTETARESATIYSKYLYAELLKQYERYQSKHLLLLYGGDFEYEDATKYFQNIDAMISTINKLGNKTRKGNPQIRVHYSSPTCFVHALSKENRSWPIRQGDFMSYAHRAHAFWTGFYTSRPGIKLYERSISALYQSTRQLSIVADHVNFTGLFQLAEVMGLLQHHDTITGTSPMVNIDDALQRMHRAEEVGQTLSSSLYQSILTPTVTTGWSTPLFSCKLNESYCEPLTKVDKKDIRLSAIIYNPSSISNQVWLRIPVAEQQTISLDAAAAKQSSIDAQEIGLMKLSPAIYGIALKQSRNQFHELVVRVQVPPLSVQAVPLTISRKAANVEELAPTTAACSIQNQNYVITTDEHGSINLVKVKATGKEYNFKQWFGYYASSGADHRSHQSSGLYVFRPTADDPAKHENMQQFYCVKRSGYEEIIQIYSTYVNQSIRLLDNAPYIEFDWVVGRLNTNVEFVTRYQCPGLANDGVFYTDSSGRSLMTRKRDQRDGYKFAQSVKSAGNYYPLVSGIVLKDPKEDLQMSVVTDRPQGGGSIEDGQIEIMIHRRVITDDSLGVSETLNEVGVDNQGLVVRGRHLLALTKIEDGAQFFREHALKSVWKPVINFRIEDGNEPLVYKTWSLLKAELPPQVNILTIEPVSQEGQVLTVVFRVEHFYERKEHSTLSKSVSLNIHEIFHRHKVHEAKEVTLGANMNMSEAFERLKWQMQPTTDDKQEQRGEIPAFDGQTINLSPMQIRSFIIKLEKR